MTKIERDEMLDSVQVNKTTIDARIILSNFKPGDEVLAYYWKTKRYHRARITSSSMQPYFYVGNDGEVNVWGSVWRHKCEVLDNSISATTLEVREAFDWSELRDINDDSC